MAPLQRLKFITSQADCILIRRAHVKARDLTNPRIRLALSIISRGAINITDLERAMYQEGDVGINQPAVSNTIHLLLKYHLVKRAYPDGVDYRLHYYIINQKELTRIHEAVTRYADYDRASSRHHSKVNSGPI